jgi:hypothetical protein
VLVFWKLIQTIQYAGACFLDLEVDMGIESIVYEAYYIADVVADYFKMGFILIGTQFYVLLYCPCKAQIGLVRF